MLRKHNSIDFIVVGQGMAGSLLAWTLIKKGMNVLVIDDQHKNASSVVAAGIINPITGHRINISNDIDIFLPNALSLYQEMGTYFKTQLVYALPQLRLIKKQGQLDYWQKRKQQASYQPYLGELHDCHDFFYDAAFGIAEIKQTYRIAVDILLKNTHEWLLDQHALQNEKFDYQALHIKESGVVYQGIEAKGVIFCEGFQTIYNPWWQHLPFKLAKGEVLNLQSDQLPQTMLNWGHWILPMTNSQTSLEKRTFKLGSNYAWDTVDFSPSSDIKELLLNSMNSNIKLKTQLIDHQVGIRPTTLHRQAFVGEHSKYKRLFCFNGFGSKGCLTIPYHAALLTNHLFEQTKLPKAVTQYL